MGLRPQAIAAVLARFAAPAVGGATGSASATGATEITFTIATPPNTYAGVEWGITGYIWSTLDAEPGEAHTIVVTAADGVLANYAYQWRVYYTTDPLDAPESRVYGTTGTVNVGTPATVPSAPAAPTLGTATTTTQPLTWVAPSDGGSEITDYVIQISANGTDWTTVEDGINASLSYTVTGLTFGTLYYYRIAAVNLLGQSAFSPAASGSTASPSYEAESSALFAAMVPEPDATRKFHIDTFVKALKTAGIWAKLDQLHVLAAHSEQAALLNWKTPGSQALVKLATPTFEADRGITVGVGVTGALQGQTNLSALSQFQQDSAHKALWCRTANAGLGTDYDFGTANSSSTNRIRIRSSSNGSAWGVNNTVETGGTTDASGFWLGTRFSANDIAIYRNGALFDSSNARASVAPAASLPQIGRTGSVTYGDTRQFALVSLGADLNAEEQAYYDAALAYMTAVGAA